MTKNSSFHKKLTLESTLFLISTPIGNLSDVTLRALEVLKAVNIVACEDTRRSRKLLTAYDVHPKSIVSLHSHNEERQTEALLRALKQGASVALLSDAGAPLLSDPGYRLVRAIAEVGAGIRIEALPGPSAVVTALQLSALPPHPFTFLGFLPSKEAARRAFLEDFKKHKETLVCFETIHRINESLSDMEDVLGDRRAALCREMTKVHEEVLRGTFSEIRKTLAAREGGVSGEITLVVDGASSETFKEEREASARERLERLLKDGVPPSEAARDAAHAFGVPRKEIYRLAVELKNLPKNRP